MKTVRRQSGFTLIEIMVAVGIILGILSMLYGTYSAISRSIRTTTDRTVLFQQGQAVLVRLIQQIRCSYAGTYDDMKYTTGAMELTGNKSRRNPDYFSCSQGRQGDEILRMITAKGSGRPHELSEGLLEVAYKFDRSEGRLYSSEERFVGTTDDRSDKANWRLIAESIESIKFKFLDGEQWLNSWSFEEMKKLPTAVEIDFNLRSETGQIHNLHTVIHICPRKECSQHGELTIAREK